MNFILGIGFSFVWGGGLPPPFFVVVVVFFISSRNFRFLTFLAYKILL